MNPKTSKGVLYNKFQLESETLQWLNSITNPAQPVEISAINQFIRQCKNDGNWQLLDRFWLFAQSNQTNARRSIVNPTNTLTENNSPTWTQYLGYTGNGTTMYLDLNYNPTTSNVNYSQNNASFGWYSRTNLDGSYNDIGAFNAGANVMTCNVRIANILNYFVNAPSTGSVPSVANSDSSGMFHFSRVSSTQQQSWRNGVNLDTFTLTSSTSPNMNVYFLARNNGGTAAVFSPRQYSMAFIGGGAINQSKFYNAFQTLATQLKFNV